MTMDDDTLKAQRRRDVGSGTDEQVPPPVSSGGAVKKRKSPKTSKPKKKRFRFLRWMWGGMRRFFIMVGFLVTVSIVVYTISFFSLFKKALPPLPDEVVLSYKLSGNFNEVPNKPSFSDPLAMMRPTLRNFVETLEKAQVDDRVKGLVVFIDSGVYTYAQIQEIHAALNKFKKSGKFSYAYAPSFGDFQNGTNAYYLASGFDEIWMQPTGMLSINGINAEMPFFGELLKENGVEAQLYQRKEFKGAAETFTRANMSEPNRAMMRDLVANLSSNVIRSTAKNRGISAQSLAKIMDTAPLLDTVAKEAKLIDHLDYHDGMIRVVREKAGEKSELLNVFEYAARKDRFKVPDKFDFSFGKTEELPPPKKVALVYVVGAIVPHDISSRAAPADEISEAILEAAEDEDVTVIVLRVDSPGGSPTASETIRRAVVVAKSKGKKVIVSMANAAASGGYWISTDADIIVALPTTLTGSIGVYGGKIVFGELLKKFGVNIDGISAGKMARLWSKAMPFNEVGEAKINQVLDNIYANFIQRVAQGRKMSPAQVEKIAKGRVWTGAQAKKIGLVDELGGLDTAFALAMRESGVTDRADIEIVQFPEPKSRLQIFLQLFTGGVKARQGIYNQPHVEMMNSLKAIVDAGARPETLIVRMPIDATQF